MSEPPLAPPLVRHDAVLRTVVLALHAKAGLGAVQALGGVSQRLRVLVGSLRHELEERRQALEDEPLRAVAFRLGIALAALPSQELLDWPLRFMADADWRALSSLLQHPLYQRPY